MVVLLLVLVLVLVLVPDWIPSSKRLDFLPN